MSTPVRVSCGPHAPAGTAAVGGGGGGGRHPPPPPPATVKAPNQATSAVTATANTHVAPHADPPTRTARGTRRSSSHDNQPAAAPTSKPNRPATTIHNAASAYSGTSTSDDRHLAGPVQHWPSRE
jgi:hypothetical protein